MLKPALSGLDFEDDEPYVAAPASAMLGGSDLPDVLPEVALLDGISGGVGPAAMVAVVSHEAHEDWQVSVAEGQDVTVTANDRGDGWADVVVTDPVSGTAQRGCVPAPCLVHQSEHGEFAAAMAYSSFGQPAAAAPAVPEPPESTSVRSGGPKVRSGGPKPAAADAAPAPAPLAVSVPPPVPPPHAAAAVTAAATIAAATTSAAPPAAAKIVTAERFEAKAAPPPEEDNDALDVDRPSDDASNGSNNEEGSGDDDGDEDSDDDDDDGPGTEAFRLSTARLHSSAFFTEDLVDNPVPAENVLASLEALLPAGRAPDSPAKSPQPRAGFPPPPLRAQAQAAAAAAGKRTVVKLVWDQVSRKWVPPPGSAPLTPLGGVPPPPPPPSVADERRLNALASMFDDEDSVPGSSLGRVSMGGSLSRPTQNFDHFDAEFGAPPPPPPTALHKVGETLGCATGTEETCTACAVQ